MHKILTTLIFLIPVFFVTGSCGRGQHETVEAIVNSFNNYYNKKFSCPVEMVDFIYEDKPNIVGAAFGSPCKVLVKKDYWEKITFDQRELLIYHELGHIYGAIHDNSKHPNDSSRPLSIMNSELFLKYTFYRDEYKEELRHRLNNNP